MLGEEGGSRYQPLQSLDDSAGLTALPTSVLVPCCHVQQESNWDCGIACVAMILNDQHRSELLSGLNSLGDEEGFKHSVWTIDLAYLLKKYSVPHIFYTHTIGVDPGYAKEDFYTKVMDLDQERVQSRFECAANCAVSVIQRSLTLNEILKHVSTQKPAIVLVDSNLLCCDSCTSLFERGNIFRWPCCALKVPYIGHFIVVCGYDLNTKKVLYRNPTYKNRVCSTSFEDFELARHSYGTDDDIILVE